MQRIVTLVGFLLVTVVTTGTNIHIGVFGAVVVVVTVVVGAVVGGAVVGVLLLAVLLLLVLLLLVLLLLSCKIHLNSFRAESFFTKKCVAQS